MERLSRFFREQEGRPGSPRCGTKGGHASSLYSLIDVKQDTFPFGVMDASITEDKCEGINMRRHGRNQTERTGWVHSPLGVLGSFLLRFPPATDTGPAGGLGKGGKKGKSTPKAAKNTPQSGGKR